MKPRKKLIEEAKADGTLDKCEMRCRCRIFLKGFLAKSVHGFRKD